MCIKVSAICKTCKTKYDVLYLKLHENDPKWKYKYCSPDCKNKSEAAKPN